MHSAPIIRPHPWIALLLLVAAPFGARSADTETRVITGDLSLAPDSRHALRLVVRGSHVILDGHGATLQGPGRTEDLATLESAGIGIRVEGGQDVTLRHFRVRGFATGLVVRDGTAIRVEDCDFSDNYDNPRHGWGELPPRGGMLFERCRLCVVDHCLANRVWDALHLVDTDDTLVTDCDLSHCSNTCAKLWHASRNRFLRNNLSYGIRIDRAAGEVHARDSTSVLIESGSDDNYWYRNDVTHGGDGIFIRVLNGWASRGNVFVENDTSYANNNCVESWSPGNTYIRNRANHGSYGFWLGGSDQTVLIGNEAAYNGLTNGNHNAPEPGFGHGGIVVVGGASSHTVADGNWCHHNRGGGIVFRGDAGSRGARWRTHHWVIQNNRLEDNQWGIWGRWGDEIWVFGNASSNNVKGDFLEDVTRLHRAVQPAMAAAASPRARLTGPGRATVGQPVRWDASASQSPSARPLRFHWVDGAREAEGAVWEQTYDRPGFHRLGVTVEDGLAGDVAWRDVIVTSPVAEELGTEGAASKWGFELEGNGDGRGRVSFEDDTDAVAGRTALRFRPDPYPGMYATAIYPALRDADMDFSAKSRVRFWIRATNPNLPGFQNAAPVFWIYTRGGPIRLQPARDGNLFSDLPFSEARWTWMPVEIPIQGDGSWSRTGEATADLRHVRGVGVALDSWGGDPFTVWLDGLSVE
jgi:parallel beta-helix repeat protein